MKSYRSGILTFCGSSVDIDFDVYGIEGKMTFRKYDNGQYQQGKQQGKQIITRHPNIVKAVITGKKSWGLWVNEWSDGIVEGTFTQKEILQQFEDNGIVIPESLLKDFDNRIINKMKKKYGW